LKDKSFLLKKIVNIFYIFVNMLSLRKNADKSFASFHVYVCAAVLVREEREGEGERESLGGRGRRGRGSVCERRRMNMRLESKRA
jgi:hypothetical protein